VVRLPGRTPVILIDVPGEGEDAVLLYGHLDKQPEMARAAPGSEGSFALAQRSNSATASSI
jgi:hypothetical protein